MSSYFQACSEISAHIADLENPTAKQIQQIQNTVAKKHHLSSTPKLSHISKKFVSKPIRSASGVSVIAVMCKPHRCPHSYFHNVCLYCPGGVDSDFEYSAQSYTGFEPTSMRAIRNRYSAYEQVRCRVRQLKMLGHEVSKVEVIIMGGTFLSLDLKYKRKFISDIYAATSGCLEPVKVFSHKQEDFSIVRNKSSTSSVKERCCTEKDVLSRDNNNTSSQNERCCNEKDVTSQPNKRDVNTQCNNVYLQQNGTLLITEPTASQISKSLTSNPPFPYEFLDTARLEKCGMRIVGLTIETRPDFCTPKFIDEMLSFGTTRLEMGVQSVYEDIARNTNRGHSVGAVKKTFCVLKDCGYKIISHLMPNLPYVSVERDRSCFLEFFENPSFRADGLKIYPTLVIRNTGLYELWRQKKYTNYGLEFLIDFLADVMSLVPPYCRVYRIQRDIPVPIVSAGLSVGNVRELVEQRMKDAGKKCRDIRGREIGIRKIKEKGLKQQRRLALFYEDYRLSNRFIPKHSLNSSSQENCEIKMAVEAQKIRNFDFFTAKCRRGTQIEQVVFLNEKDDYEEFEVIRRDYVANEGWETFLSYENIEEDSLAGMLRMRKCGANVYREEMQTEGNFTYIKNKCKKFTETKSEYVNNIEKNNENSKNNNEENVENNNEEDYENNEKNRVKNVEDNCEKNNKSNNEKNVNDNEKINLKNVEDNCEKNNKSNNEKNVNDNEKINLKNVEDNKNNYENNYENNNEKICENNIKNKLQYEYKQRMESNNTYEITSLNRFQNTSYSNQMAKISNECMEIIKSFHKNTPLKQEIREKIPNKLQISENDTNFKTNNDNLKMPIFNTTLIREIHVYGDQANISKNDKKYQHRGIGKNLLKIAENIAKGEHKSQKIVIIAGIGVRDYYRKLGYALEGAYMVKYI